MASVHYSQTATILNFPTANRLAAVNLGKKAKFAAEVRALAAQHVDYGGWYHDEAIAEDALKLDKSPHDH